MISLKLCSIKDATRKLFTETPFDFFSVLEASIVSYVTFTMDGHCNPDFFEEGNEEPPRLVSWKRLRPICYEIIKGKRIPISFQILFFITSAEAANSFSEPDLTLNRDIDGYTVRIFYKSRTLTLSTGTVFKTFSMDRESERLFDECLIHWLRGITLETENLMQ